MHIYDDKLWLWFWKPHVFNQYAILRYVQQASEYYFNWVSINSYAFCYHRSLAISRGSTLTPISVDLC